MGFYSFSKYCQHVSCLCCFLDLHNDGRPAKVSSHGNSLVTFVEEKEQDIIIDLTCALAQRLYPLRATVLVSLQFPSGEPPPPHVGHSHRRSPSAGLVEKGPMMPAAKDKELLHLATPECEVEQSVGASFTKHPEINYPGESASCGDTVNTLSSPLSNGNHHPSLLISISGQTSSTPDALPQ